MELDVGMLNLKPNVVVKTDNDTESYSSKTDQPIRPYPNRPTSGVDTVVSEQSHLGQNFDYTVSQRGFTSNVASIQSTNDPADGTADDYNNFENDCYDLVFINHIETELGFFPSYGTVVMSDGAVFYQKVEEMQCELMKSEVDSSNSIEDDRTLEILAVKDCSHADKGPDQEEKWTEEFRHLPPDPLNGEENATYPKFELNPSYILTNAPEAPDILKIAGGKTYAVFQEIPYKKHRLKRLIDTQNIFRFFAPPLVDITVLPLSRQSQGQNPRGPNGSQDDSFPPSQPPLGQSEWPPDKVNDLRWSTFKQELYRVGTFILKSPSFPVSTLKLAQVGFLCLDDGTIRCYFCGLHRDEWSAGESPEQIHRQLSPSCPRLTGEGSNIPVNSSPDGKQLEEVVKIWSLSGPSDFLRGHPDLPRTTGGAASVSAPGALMSGSLQNENVSPGAQQLSASSVAAAGGSASSQTSGVAAALNQNASEGSNQANQNPNGVGNQGHNVPQARPGNGEGAVANANSGSGNVEQLQVFDGTAQPEAPGNVARTQTAPAHEPRDGRQVVTYQQLGIVTETPKRMEMAMVNSRVGTFRNWSSSHSLTPLALSEAGFYYAGYADCGRCFFCGGGLKNWEPTDNPWVEHARWFPKCAYVRQCQGQDFIDVVQELAERNQDQRITWAQVREELSRRHADGEPGIQEPVVDPAITGTLDVGYNQDAIDDAVLRLRNEGHMLTAGRLVDYLQTDGAVATGGGDILPAENELDQIDELLTASSEIRQQRTCKICLDKEVCIVFLPCGHLVCCAECAPALRNCPMCRQRIKGRVRAFPA